MPRIFFSFRCRRSTFATGLPESGINSVGSSALHRLVSHTANDITIFLCFQKKFIVLFSICRLASGIESARLCDHCVCVCVWLSVCLWTVWRCIQLCLNYITWIIADSLTSNKSSLVCFDFCVVFTLNSRNREKEWGGSSSCRSWLAGCTPHSHQDTRTHAHRRCYMHFLCFRVRLSCDLLWKKRSSKGIKQQPKKWREKKKNNDDREWNKFSDGISVDFVGIAHRLCISIQHINYTQMPTKVEKAFFNWNFGLPFIIAIWFLVDSFLSPLWRTAAGAEKGGNSICQTSSAAYRFSNYRIGLQWDAVDRKTPKQNEQKKKKIENSFLCPEFICILFNWTTIFVVCLPSFISTLVCLCVCPNTSRTETVFAHCIFKFGPKQ